jgi:hypothetical protein
MLAGPIRHSIARFPPNDRRIDHSEREACFWKFTVTFLDDFLPDDTPTRKRSILAA